MTREEKIEKKQRRAFLRKAKRIEKDKSYLQTAFFHNRSGLSWGRRKQNGRIWTCEMGYGNCEKLGYCNGDC